MPTPYTPAGLTFPAFPWNLINDGEVYNYDSIQKSGDPAKGLFGLCMDAIAYLKNYAAGSDELAKQTASSGDTLIGVLTYAGSFLTLPTGTLRTVLSYIANNAANGVALAKQTASSGDTLIGVLTIASATAVGLGTSASSTLRDKLQFIFDTAIADLPSTSVAPGASAVTIDATVSRVYHVDTPTQAIQTITLKSTSPAPAEGAEIQFAAYSIANTKQVIVDREDASQLTIMLGAASGSNFGSARFKFISGKWRMLLATGLAAHGGVVDGAINDP